MAAEADGPAATATAMVPPPPQTDVPLPPSPEAVRLWDDVRNGLEKSQTGELIVDG